MGVDWRTLTLWEFGALAHGWNAIHAGSSGPADIERLKAIAGSVH